MLLGYCATWFTAELGQPVVVSVRTELGMQPSKRDRPGGPDTTPLVFHPFKSTLPETRKTAQWALSCIEVNWDYARQGVRYRLMEINRHERRIPLLIKSLEKLAPTQHALLTEKPMHFNTPPWYDHNRVHDCPIVLWLKPVQVRAKTDGLRSRSPPTARHVPPPASWSSSAWNWHDNAPWYSGR